MVNVWYTGALVVLAAANVNADICGDASITTTDSTITQSAPETTSTVSSEWKLSSLKHPAITGHRGASGYLPDHTIEGYTFAIEVGVDVIEPDLVITKDGALVVRHEPYIDGTTNVADHPEFASRRSNKTLDGVRIEGYFVSDFTLAEIKTLRAVQPLSERDQSYNGLYEIPTFEEVIQLAQNKSAVYNRTIAIYPEVKHSSFHKALGLPIENTMMELLTKYDLNHADAPVFIQSFETQNLRELHHVTNITLVQLIDAFGSDPTTGDLIFVAPSDRPYDWTLANRTENYGYLTTPAGLAEVATYADVIAPYKRYLLKAIAVEIDENGNIADSNDDGTISDADYYIFEDKKIIDDAHAAGLKVHTWTMRDENYRLAVNYSGNATLEYLELFDMGVDGLFSDNCKTAVPARDFWLTLQ
ncbi:Glycerophosphoryl diester phosphodiesterase [Phytophthora megakarya]|uniref:glycerophosphodiester phosphodiesterase n=1 Tax=Phytophthora megakarya TaxID=4795 RepID=A0A225VDU3_9STRA|nr:Glycerophosphoryl diester phosphodiesterase [Phytophthora megakarya]